jgi:protein AATF/BFR2
MDIDDVELLYEHYRSSTEAAHKAVEKSIVKWSNKTALLSQISQSNYTSLLMQTPIGQAGKVLTSLDKVLPKSRLKRSVFRQLFAPPEDIKQTTNDQIFDDFDLFHQLEK